MTVLSIIRTAAKDNIEICEMILSTEVMCKELINELEFAEDIN
jgi:hypothetical protein